MAKLEAGTPRWGVVHVGCVHAGLHAVPRHCCAHMQQLVHGAQPPPPETCGRPQGSCGLHDPCGGAAAAGEVGALLASTFTLVFAAEWGDKSFLATIALAASSDPVGVTLGAVAGHGVATGFAVLGGSLLSRSVSEQAVQYLGGSLFLVFAAGSLFDIYQQLA